MLLEKLMTLYNQSSKKNFYRLFFTGCFMEEVDSELIEPIVKNQVCCVLLPSSAEEAKTFMHNV